MLGLVLSTARRVMVLVTAKIFVRRLRLCLRLSVLERHVRIATAVFKEPALMLGRTGTILGLWQKPKVRASMMRIIVLLTK